MYMLQNLSVIHGLSKYFLIFLILLGQVLEKKKEDFLLRLATKLDADFRKDREEPKTYN